jgi:4,5-dihydroxyphthalate decarboxylase
MTSTRINVVALAHDWLSPIRSGDVSVPGVEISFDHETRIEDFVLDSPHEAGEMSLARTLLRWSRGDHRFVPIPLFVYRSFVHREYFVRRESTLRSLADLAGKRVALAGWPNTGNTWARAVLREAGVAPEEVDWFVFEESDPDADHLNLSLPEYIRRSPKKPLDLLLESEVDAVVMGETPLEVRQPAGALRRLCADFSETEADFFSRTGIYPGHHILGVRREVVDQDPTIVRKLYESLVEARRRWFERRIDLEETSPWLAADIDRSMLLFNGSWYQDGMSTDANRRMLRALHAEQVAEGLSSQSFDPLSVFQEFERSQSVTVAR